ncbi:hypothetical protein PR048_003070 [Dryococelus australis]|uniref:Uncharacterized protein n=1 Tax=Dryococelus australis TaxID=614101 RepID=A0ABQ9ILZ8_9NEOP|nr:hypothetical protein PR048_003070 [Dryococelus australis]
MSTPYEHLTVHPAVGNSHVVELARKLRDVWNSVKQRNHSVFLQQAAQYNKKAVNKQYKVGDLVYLNNPVLKKNQVKKFQQVWKGPFPVIEVQLHYQPLQLKINIVPVGNHLSCLQPRLQSRRSQDLQIRRLQILPRHTYRKAAKFSPPNSPSTPMRPPIPYNLRRRHQ